MLPSSPASGVAKPVSQLIISGRSKKSNLSKNLFEPPGIYSTMNAITADFL
jgi:hypothetical protein